MLSPPPPLLHYNVAGLLLREIDEVNVVIPRVMSDLTQLNERRGRSLYFQKVVHSFFVSEVRWQSQVIRNDDKRVIVYSCTRACTAHKAVSYG